MSEWTYADISELKELLSDGHSAAAAARVLGRTRSAVIGKASRLGFDLGGASGPRKSASLKESALAIPLGAAPKKRKRRRRARPKIVIDRNPPEGACHEQPPFSRCQYIFGSSTGPDRLYCNRKSVAGGAYCEMHQSITHFSSASYDAWRAQQKDIEEGVC